MSPTRAPSGGLRNFLHAVPPGPRSGPGASIGGAPQMVLLRHVLQRMAALPHQ